MSSTAFRISAVALIIIASTMQIAAAAERHHQQHKIAHRAVGEAFRNANDAIARPDGYTAPHLPSYYSGGYSAPAGH